VNWAILRGDNLTGNTMMMLDAGADTGDIVDQRPVSIEPEDTCGTVYERIGQVGAEMLDHHLAGLLAGTAPHYPQPPDKGDLLPKRTPEMGVIDWSRPATALHDWIRALTVPYPGAFTTFEGRRIMVWQSQPPTGENGDGDRDGEPGTVLGFVGDAVRVATGRGALTVTAMADPGAAPAPAAAWCRASGVTPGTRLDPIPPELARWTLGLGPRPDERGTENQ
jgi:methionyl-tRNA formyltransferase